MPDSGEEYQETYSACVIKKEQRAYIKIKCLRGNTVPIITANLRETCSYDAVNCSTVARWFKWFQEGKRSMEDDAWTGHLFTTIDNTWVAIVPTLLDNNTQMAVGEMECIRYTENNNTTYFNWISDEEKGCGMVGITHAVFLTKTMFYWSVSETFDSL